MSRHPAGVHCKTSVMSFLSCVALTFSAVTGTARAKSIVGFAAPGATSHIAAFATIGVELVRRGHNFTLLLSSEDTLGQARVARGFESIDLLSFSGAAGVGSEGWLRGFTRDPKKARAALSLRRGIQFDASSRHV